LSKDVQLRRSKITNNLQQQSSQQNRLPKNIEKIQEQTVMWSQQPQAGG